MSTTASPVVPTHPVTAGAVPAVLWVTGRALNLAALAAGLVLAFWYAEYAVQRSPRMGLTLAGVIPLYATLFLARWMFRAARFRTPGGLVSPRDQSTLAQMRARTPGWMATILEYAVMLVLVSWMLHTPRAGMSAAAAASEWTTAQVYVLGIVPIISASVALLVARYVYEAVTTRSWVPLVDTALALSLAAALMRTTAFVHTPETADITGGLTATFVVMVLIFWAVVTFARHNARAFPSDEGLDPAAALLTWWHGAPTLEDRRHYKPLIHAGMIGVAVVVALVFVALMAVV